MKSITKKSETIYVDEKNKEFPIGRWIEVKKQIFKFDLERRKFLKNTVLFKTYLKNWEFFALKAVKEEYGHFMVPLHLTFRLS